MFIAIPAILFFSFALIGVTTKRAGWFVPSVFFLVFWFAMLFFFRDPLRPVPETDAIVSPADGTIVAVDTDQWGATKIAIFLSPMNVHVIRAPMTSEVLDAEFIPGIFLRADNPEAGDKNQQERIILDTEYGRVVLRVISGFLVRRVIVPLEAGDLLTAGQRIGFVRFGSRSEITLPKPFRPIVRVGDPVFGGVTRLGHWLPEEMGDQIGSDHPDRQPQAEPEPQLVEAGGTGA
ncbi:MAG: phosphatidylserine decarboxylase [bacterium]